MPRHKEFDPDVALEKAMQVFWTKGYHDTSIRDLVAATGVNYYGLYEVWDSKHGLFLAALDHYSRAIAAETLPALRGDGPLDVRLKRGFDKAVSFLTQRDGPPGCLMCNTMIELSAHDPAVAEITEAARKRITGTFAAALSSDGGRTKSEVRSQAEFLTTTFLGLGLLLRSGADTALVHRHVKTALTAV